MAQRLGNVLYWVATALAALLLALAAIFPIMAERGTSGELWLVSLAIAACGVIVWLIGRACRYVLAGS